MNKRLEKQMEKTADKLSPTGTVYEGLKEFYKLIQLFYAYIEDKMTKLSKVLMEKTKKVEKKKMTKVMDEFKSGKLHSGSKKGPEVTNPKQAVAIGLSEARKAGAKIPKKGK